MDRFPCDQTLIDNLGYYDDIYSNGAFLACQSSTSVCAASLFQDNSARTYCTDFSIAVQISTGSLLIKQTLSRSTNILIGFTGSAWASVIISSSGALSGNWHVISRIDLTNAYPLNSSPGKFRIKNLKKSILLIIF